MFTICVQVTPSDEVFENELKPFVHLAAVESV